MYMCIYIYIYVYIYPHVLKFLYVHHYMYDDDYVCTLVNMYILVHNPPTPMFAGLDGVFHSILCKYINKY